MTRPYDEEIDKVQKHYLELNESRQDKAQKLFEKLNEYIDKMNELGYNITVCVEVGGEKHWCEWNYSFVDIDMCKLG